MPAYNITLITSMKLIKHTEN